MQNTDLILVLLLFNIFIFRKLQATSFYYKITNLMKQNL